jgi:nucleotide-binding universal stress UspA family protein
MFRTILVPASGSDTDAVVFETALAAARPQHAHIEFFHVCVSAGEALRYMPHASFARGDALHNVLQELKQESEHRSDAAQRHVRDFCKRHKIAMLDMPGRCPALSASWRTEAVNGEDPFITRARVHDLVVMGRFTRPNGLPPNLLQLLLVECGRPIMIAAPRSPRAFHTVMVAWKDTREAARAVTAAMPLLSDAKRVVVAAVEEREPCANTAAIVAGQLAWHGIRAHAQSVKADGRPVATVLAAAADACDANLLVMGSYSTGPLRQEIFGGCTRSMLNEAAIPVFLVH